MKSTSPTQKFNPRKEREIKAWKEIIKRLARLTSVYDIENFLATLITTHEREQIVKRATAVPLLRQGKSYREIGKLLWLSPATISAIKKATRSKNYVSTYGWDKPSRTKRKLRPMRGVISSTYHRKRNAWKTPPHGKLVFPQRRR